SFTQRLQPVIILRRLTFFCVPALSAYRLPKTGARVGKIASKGLSDPGSLTNKQIKTLAASALTQRTPALILHQTIIPCSPERIRRLIFSLICSSRNAANAPKPTRVGINILPSLGSALDGTNPQLGSPVGPRDPPQGPSGVYWTRQLSKTRCLALSMTAREVMI